MPVSAKNKELKAYSAESKKPRESSKLSKCSTPKYTINISNENISDMWQQVLPSIVAHQWIAIDAIHEFFKTHNIPWMLPAPSDEITDIVFRCAKLCYQLFIILVEVEVH